MKKRNIMYISISIICVVSIILGVYYQIFADKVVNENDVNTVTNTIDNTSDVESPEKLLEEFNKLFTNEFFDQNCDTSNITKWQGLEIEDVIYTMYDIEEETEKYSINIKIPVFNVLGDEATTINNTTQKIFIDKLNSIWAGTEKYTIYNIEYVAYLNDDILSLVIKASLKEGESAQRIIVQTYNYDIQTGKSITLNELIEREGYKIKQVNNKIEKQIEEASKQAEAISQATGKIMYKRDLNNAMYATDNVTNFFMGKDGQIYIIYAYGNNNLTSEIDIIKL